jgi:spore coat polysaccharide biosynthesis protein SpsF
MGSTRLPGKVLLPLAGGRVIDHVVARAAAIPGVDHVVVATSTRNLDDPLVEHVRAAGLAQVVRGPELDCLTRFLLAQEASRAEVLVRITADCPLLDPEVSGRSVAHFHAAAGSLDYVSNVFARRTWPRGLDTEVFSAAALQQASRDATDATHREHVTQFIWSQPERFRCDGVHGEDDHSAHRWTLDTPDDLALIERIFSALWSPRASFDTADVLALLDTHPDWVALNAHVKQKLL